MKLSFRPLRADEVQARVNTVGEKGYTLLLYKDARCDQDILDETVGAMNWQRRHYEVKGNMYCSVGIRDSETGEWTFKDDCGTESNTEAEKGEASDSFKRACVNWGIGRELYTKLFIWIPGGTKPTEQKDRRGREIYKLADPLAHHTVEELEVSGGKIVRCVISRTSGSGKDKVTEEVYSYPRRSGSSGNAGAKLVEELVTPDQAIELYNLAVEKWRDQAGKLFLESTGYSNANDVKRRDYERVKRVIGFSAGLS